MLRSTNFDSLLSACTIVEQILDYSARALYDHTLTYLNALVTSELRLLLQRRPIDLPASTLSIFGSNFTLIVRKEITDREAIVKSYQSHEVTGFQDFSEISFLYRSQPKLPKINPLRPNRNLGWKVQILLVR